MAEVAWLVRQVVIFAAYVYLHLILIFAMTALFFGFEEPR